MLDGVTLIDNQAVAPVLYLSLTVPEALFRGEVYNTTPPEGMTPHPQDRPIAELWALAGQIFFVPVEVSENWKERNIILNEVQRVESKLPERPNDPLPTYGREEVVLQEQVGVLNAKEVRLLSIGMRQLRGTVTLAFVSKKNNSPIGAVALRGEIYEESQKRHPLDLPLAQIWSVKGFGRYDGDYSVPVSFSDDRNVVKFYPKAAQKILKPLPERQSTFPKYAKFEVFRDEERGIIDRDRSPELYQALCDGIQTLYRHTVRANIIDKDVPLNFLGINEPDFIFEGDVYNAETPIAELWSVASRVFFVPVKVSEDKKTREVFLQEAQRTSLPHLKKKKTEKKFYISDICLDPQKDAINQDNDPLLVDKIKAGMRRLRDTATLAFH